MEQRRFGRTGLTVSALAFGTASLGMEYGIPAPGEFGRPAKRSGIRLLHEAAEAGMNLFDTAPGYGESERLLGQALGGRKECFFATKVAVPRGSGGVALADESARATVWRSIEDSLRALRRDVIDVVQIHNATADVVAGGPVMDALLEAREAGDVRFIGASVYGTLDATAVLDAPGLDVLQVAYNLLDQRMGRDVLPRADAEGVGLLLRSAYLKGVLTPKARWLPVELLSLRQAAERVCTTFGIGWSELPRAALRFCLAAGHQATVLVGIRNRTELRYALEAAAAGPLAASLQELAAGLAVDDEGLLNPRNWPLA